MGLQSQLILYALLGLQLLQVYVLVLRVTNYLAFLALQIVEMVLFMEVKYVMTEV